MMRTRFTVVCNELLVVFSRLRVVSYNRDHTCAVIRSNLPNMDVTNTTISIRLYCSHDLLSCLSFNSARDRP
jgi:hypothetical protein